MPMEMKLKVVSLPAVRRFGRHLDFAVGVFQQSVCPRGMACHVKFVGPLRSVKGAGRLLAIPLRGCEVGVPVGIDLSNGIAARHES